MSGTNFHRSRDSDTARKNQGDMRARIQTGMLISRLHGFVNGDHDMTAAAVTAALGLLRKTLPDLTHSEVVGEDGGPLAIVIRDLAAERRGDKTSK